MRDLINAGVLGLLDAVDKFEPERGVKFKTYAEIRIRGTILDSLRDLDLAPRSLRKKARISKGSTPNLDRNSVDRPQTKRRLQLLAEIWKIFTLSSTSYMV